MHTNSFLVKEDVLITGVHCNISTPLLYKLDYHKREVCHDQISC